MRPSKLYTTIALMFSISLCGAFPAYGACEDRLKACDVALRASQDVIGAQDASIANLKAANKELASRLADSQSAPLLPTWAYIALGALAGAATYSIVRSH